MQISSNVGQLTVVNVFQNHNNIAANATVDINSVGLSSLVSVVGDNANVQMGLWDGSSFYYQNTGIGGGLIAFNSNVNARIKNADGVTAHVYMYSGFQFKLT